MAEPGLRRVALQGPPQRTGHTTFVVRSSALEHSAEPLKQRVAPVGTAWAGHVGQAGTVQAGNYAAVAG